MLQISIYLKNNEGTWLIVLSVLMWLLHTQCSIWMLGISIFFFSFSLEVLSIFSGKIDKRKGMALLNIIPLVCGLLAAVISYIT